MCTISREEAAWRRGAREKKGRGGAEKREKLCLAIWHGKQEMLVACARVFRMGKKVFFPLQPFELWAPYEASWVWVGAVIFDSATPRRYSIRRTTRQIFSEEE
jgi:hypothetical protein